MRKSIDAIRSLGSRRSSHRQSDDAMDHPHSSFRQMNDEELGQLAAILAHQNSPEVPLTETQKRNHHDLITSQIELLPASIRAVPGHQSRSLCATHTGLNSHLVKSTLRWIQHEVDVSIPALLYALMKANVIPTSTQERFNELREISAMWTKSDEYVNFFKRRVNPRWTRQSDHCAACVLARIGGEVDILTTLKAGMIACTASAELATSRRHKWLDAWVEKGFNAKTAGEIFGRAMVVGMQMKEAARSMDMEPTGSSAADRIQESPTSTAPLHNTPLLASAMDASMSLNDTIAHDTGKGPAGDDTNLDHDPFKIPYSPQTGESSHQGAYFMPGMHYSGTSFYSLGYGDKSPTSAPVPPARLNRATSEESDRSADQRARSYAVDLDVDAFLREIEEKEERERKEEQEGGWI